MIGNGRTVIMVYNPSFPFNLIILVITKKTVRTSNINEIIVRP